MRLARSPSRRARPHERRPTQARTPQVSVCIYGEYHGQCMTLYPNKVIYITRNRVNRSMRHTGAIDGRRLVVGWNYSPERRGSDVLTSPSPVRPDVPRSILEGTARAVPRPERPRPSKK